MSLQGLRRFHTTFTLLTVAKLASSAKLLEKTARTKTPTHKPIKLCKLCMTDSDFLCSLSLPLVCYVLLDLEECVHIFRASLGERLEL